MNRVSNNFSTPKFDQLAIVLKINRHGPELRQNLYSSRVTSTLL